jgi:hypothetical protein
MANPRLLRSYNDLRGAFAPAPGDFLNSQVPDNQAPAGWLFSGRPSATSPGRS